MSKNRLLIWITIVSIIIASALTPLMPIPKNWPPAYNSLFYFQLIINIIMAFTHLGAAALFVTNLDVYKAKLRRAYSILAAGILITGMSALQVTVLAAVLPADSPYLKSGATILPFVLSGVILYLGVRAFARLVGSKHIAQRAWVAFPIGLAGALLSTFLPHVPYANVPELGIDATVGISVWSGTLILLASWLALHIKANTGAHYTKAMAWLASALFFTSIAFFYQVLYVLISNDLNIYLSLGSGILTTVSGFVWIRAGYAFALTKYYSEDLSLMQFLFATAKATKAKPRTAIDMVTHAASLASNTQDIDPMLDKVRVITSKLEPGQSPSAEDTRRLVEVYVAIEEYLITKETVRNYTRQELRSLLDPRLLKMIPS